jgi:hypothetical protein
MDNTKPYERRLRSLLVEIGFAARYYALCDETRTWQRTDRLPRAEQLTDSLTATGRLFRYNRRENFFATRETDVPGELGLNLCLEHNVADFILVVKTPAGHIGDTFSVHALETMRLADPSFSREPPYPRPLFNSVPELKKVLGHGLALYDEIAKGVLERGLLTDCPE